jgi:transcriptional regulator with XRE-family HTH domain
MNTTEIQQLKMAWLAAKEAGDTQTQMRLLNDYPEQQAELINFIAAYAATAGTERAEPLLPLTQRALQSALNRVFAPEMVAVQVTEINLSELRKSRELSKLAAAKGLRLSLDVWEKFEAGAIELVSLSQRQLERLAQFFQVSTEQFGTLLSNSQPAFTLNRRQTREGARSEQQGPRKQSFAEAIAHSTMSKEDKRFWLEK